MHHKPQLIFKPRMVFLFNYENCESARKREMEPQIFTNRH